jgi:hypothetical protein
VGKIKPVAMRNSFIGIILLGSFLSCSCKRTCYNLREWETQELNGKMFTYIDTLEVSDKLSRIHEIDSIINITNTTYFWHNKSRYAIEASSLVKWESDSMKVYRLLKDGNLTLYYTRSFGIFLKLSRLERSELQKIENTCTKQITILDGFLRIVDKDTMLTQKLPILKSALSSKI